MTNKSARIYMALYDLRYMQNHGDHEQNMAWLLSTLHCITKRIYAKPW